MKWRLEEGDTFLTVIVRKGKVLYEKARFAPHPDRENFDRAKRLSSLARRAAGLVPLVSTQVSLPPCGGGLGGVDRRKRLVFSGGASPPTPTLPRKGGGSKTLPRIGFRLV